MDQFYIFLPSNSSREFHPDNNLSYFKTRLGKMVSLDGDWDVGLSEIIYPASESIDSLDLESEELGESFNTLTIFSTHDPDDHEIINFPKKNYRSLENFFLDILRRIKNPIIGRENVQVLLKELHAAYSNIDAIPNEEFDVSRPHNEFLIDGERIAFYVGKFESLGELINQILTLIKSKPMREKFLILATKLVMDNLGYFERKVLSHGFYSIAYIYADIIESSLTGDVQSKSLRVINLNAKGGHHVFNPVYYHKLSIFNFRDISVQIRYDDGSFVKYRRSVSPTLVVLHFKKRVRSITV